MAKYYCKNCAVKLGYFHNINPDNDFSGSVGSYKFEKFIKHTTYPSTGSNITSVFKDKDYESYKGYNIDSANSGSVEIDNNNKINILWFAGTDTGDTFQNGHFIHGNDSVKLVMHDNQLKIHSFPTGSNGFKEAICDECGTKIFI